MVLAICDRPTYQVIQCRPTKRALDGWGCQAPMRFVWAMLAGGSLAQSAAFSSIFHAQTESCSRSFIHARPPASNANRWALIR